ncbi:small multidrug efflux protein [Microbacterium sp. zg-Y818]|uniref:small multidrug efflux protein n=1 Tax=unclassified Microbacterium TaxID=2609290 RepID=UPI00214BB2A1|nr:MULTISPECIES: small multidrug efflux protein [unclassified Microbacterium]MCR2800870.1 small multidrug efflux protein [Microbacterium sp. zg.Y818]WIM23584.1 small multidrug efflux protein [Microbacterium sp. zg-Y818]
MTLIDRFQDLVAQVPDLVQPLILALAGAVPFIEGEGAAAIGIVGGIHPVVAVAAGVVGNFLCVAVLVLLSSGARTAVVTRRRESVRAREAVAIGGGAPVQDLACETPDVETTEGLGGNPTRRAKFLRALDRYGVPGVSLLGPLLLPTHFTATMLAAVGVGKVRILAWQAVAIVGWSTIIALLVTGVISAVS